MSQSTSQRQAAYRERRGIAKTITIHLTAQEAELLNRCFDTQGRFPDRRSFTKAALMTGARFVANAGTPKGQKL